MPVKAILFDKDGTFVDFHATWSPAIDHAMRAMAGGDEQAYLRLCAANHFNPETGRLANSSPFIAEASADFARRWAVALGQPMTDAFNAEIDRLLDQAALANVAPLADPAGTFAALRAVGYRVAVVTNDTEKGARLQCGKLGLDALVDAVVGYDSGHGRKPAPGQLLAVAAQFGLTPGELAMVGDTTHDLKAGRAAGALTIGVLSGFAGRDELAPLADHVIADIAALPALLAQSRG